MQVLWKQWNTAEEQKNYNNGDDNHNQALLSSISSCKGQVVFGKSGRNCYSGRTRGKLCKLISDSSRFIIPETITRGICNNKLYLNNPYLPLVFTIFYLFIIYYLWKLKTLFFLPSHFTDLLPLVKMVYKPPGHTASVEFLIN